MFRQHTSMLKVCYLLYEKLQKTWLQILLLSSIWNSIYRNYLRWLYRLMTAFQYVIFSIYEIERLELFASRMALLTRVGPLFYLLIRLISLIWCLLSDKLIYYKKSTFLTLTFGFEKITRLSFNVFFFLSNSNFIKFMS